jgi:putative transposase
MVNDCVEYALKHDISSPMKIEKALYEDFKQRYGFATHYCISASRVACSAIMSWKRLIRRGRADPNKPPVFRASAMRLQKELMRFKGDRIVVTTKPYCHIEIPLIIGSYQEGFIEMWRRGEVEVGEVTLLKDKAVVTFKKEISEKKPEGYASIDVNLMSLDVLKTKNNSVEFRKIDLRKLYGIRVHYFKKRKKIQVLSKLKPTTSKRVWEKYSKRERRKVDDFLHKLTTSLFKEFIEEEVIPIFEELKDMNYNVTRNKYNKWKNRKVASLPYRKIQRFIEYKCAWYGYLTYYVSAKNTSKTCPRCGSLSKVKGQVYECKKCGYKADRHFVACVNILKMWGKGFAPKALDELIEREELSRGNDLQLIST